MTLNLRMDEETVVHLHNRVNVPQWSGGKIVILKFAGKWINLENIMLSETTQTQKDRYKMYLLISGF